MDIFFQLVKYSNLPIGTSVLLGMLKEYKRPYDKIMDLVSQGFLVQLRKGLYMVSDKLNSNSVEPFLIANHIYGPSYISLDSALYYWGLIPERVYEVSSVTTKKSKQYEIEKLRYSYTHLPVKYFPLGISSIALTNSQHVLIASAEKSLCDKIITSSGINIRSKKDAMIYLLEDLRIDENNLRNFNLKEMQTWLSVCQKKNSIHNIIQAISEL